MHLTVYADFTCPRCAESTVTLKLGEHAKDSHRPVKEDEPAKQRTPGLKFAASFVLAPPRYDTEAGVRFLPSTVVIILVAPIARTGALTPRSMQAVEEAAQRPRRNPSRGGCQWPCRWRHVPSRGQPRWLRARSPGASGSPGTG